MVLKRLDGHRGAEAHIAASDDQHVQHLTLRSLLHFIAYIEHASSASYHRGIIDNAEVGTVSRVITSQFNSCLMGYQVSVVAQVLTVQKQATNVVYNLDDGTAQIEARHWVDPSAMDEDEENPITYG